MALELTLGSARRAARGASSEVFRARRDGREVAIKVAASREFDGSLLAEARALAFVRHASLPRVRAVGRVTRGAHAGRVALVSDWIDGVALDRAAHADVEVLVLGLARALGHLHALGLAHGDVKPANVLWTSGGPVLIDLGMSGPARDAALRAGTPRYLSTTAHEEHAAARDLFALGLVVAERAWPEVARSSEPLHAARAHASSGSDSLSAVVAALVSGAAAERPTPRALERLLSRGVWFDPGEVASRYLLARRAELSRASLVERVEVDSDVPVEVREAIELLGAVSSIEGARVDGAARLSRLAQPARARWLASLVGPSAAEWPLAELAHVDDATLVARLEELAAARAPIGWTFEEVLSVSRGVTPAPARRPPWDPVRAAFALSAPRPQPAEIDDVMARWDEAPTTLRAAAVDALRRAGRASDALTLVARAHEPPVLGALSEAARRAGCVELALSLAVRAGGDPRARGAALRVRVDRGERLEPASLEPVVPSVAEAFALGAVRDGDHAAARALASRGLTVARTDEDRARLLGVLALIDHAAGQSDASRAGFIEAAAVAARAGAIVEEATYLTGVAAASVDAGETAAGITAARRAAALFDALERPVEASRALLCEASALAILGASREALSVCRDAIALAEAGGDRRAAALARVTLADAGDPSELELASRDASGEDHLRVDARRLAAGLAVDTTAARAQAMSAGGVASLEWWVAAASRGLDVELPTLERALSAGPVAARFFAAAAGARVAVDVGARDVSLRLGLLARDLGARLTEGAPPEHRASWLARVEQQGVSGRAAEDPLRSQGKLAEALALVRALSSRERLGPLFSQILDALLLWTGAERGVFFAPAPDGRLVARVSRNVATDELRRGAPGVSRSAAARAIAERRPVTFVDTGRAGDATASVHALGLLRVLAVPLLARGRVLGVVYLDDRLRPTAFGPDDLAWVELLAGIAAAALADAFDQVMLRRASRTAARANARLSSLLAERDEALLALDAPRPSAPRARRHQGIIGASEPLLRALELCDRVASRDLPVLITGESGSGKELFARAIHDASPRRQSRFVSENCAAIPEGLLESTLFGHVRGAFTGAVAPHAGLFAIADHGTLLLDEIGEMSLAMQAKLLRVLADGEVRAVGATTARRVDVRVIGATHRDLDALVREGKFREDLLYRLRVVELRVPALRERPSDVPLLVAHLLEKHGLAGYKLTRAAMDRLSRARWPGNVRQLENELRRASVLSDGLIDLPHLSAELLGTEPARARGGLKARLDSQARALVIDALARHRNSKTAAAAELELSRFGLLKMMKRLGIDG